MNTNLDFDVTKEVTVGIYIPFETLRDKVVEELQTEIIRGCYNKTKIKELFDDNKGIIRSLIINTILYDFLDDDDDYSSFSDDIIDYTHKITPNIIEYCKEKLL